MVETCFRIQDSCYLGCHLNMVGWNATICVQVNNLAVNCYHICHHSGYPKVHEHIVSFSISHTTGKYKVNLSKWCYYKARYFRTTCRKYCELLNHSILNLWKIVFWIFCMWLLVRNICCCLFRQEVRMSGWE